jgi:bifunctional UDP-N-acetylglucosamine pyrophosphorylase / glucosamine-1-phosphate N-acetyltransferase
MSSAPIHVVVLAAGQGIRMKSNLPKVLHRVPGGSMLNCVLRTAAALSPETLTVVVGHGADAVRALLGPQTTVQFAVQEPQLGTAHALMQAAPILTGRTGTVVLLSGDVPLLTSATLRNLVSVHCGAQAAATVVTATVDRPFGYGRIVRVDGELARIVEERDASPTERQIHEINSGIYAFDLAPLFDALRSVASQNAQGEYYLTDLVAIYRRRKLLVKSVLVDDPQEVRGVNSRTELAEVSRLVRQKKNEELMASGVTLVDPAATYIDPDVEIGADTVIHPGVIIEGRTRIGAACEIHAHVTITDTEIGDHVTIKSFSVISSSRIDAGAQLGPFAHLRP